MNINKGLIEDQQNSFAVVYRLIDFAFFQCLLLVILKVNGMAYTKDYFLLGLIGSLGFILIAESVSLYRCWRTGVFKELIFHCLLAWSGGVTVVLTFLFFSKTSVDFSRMALGIWFAVTLISLVGWRFGSYIFLSKIRRLGYNNRSVAIIGLGEDGARLIEEINKRSDIGLNVAAVFDDRCADRVNDRYHQFLEGNVDQGVARARNDEFDTVYVAMPLSAQSRIQSILQKLGDTTANVHLVPTLFGHSLLEASLSRVGEIQTFSVFDNPVIGPRAMAKRLLDIGVATAALLVLGLPMMMIAIGVKLTSKGPALFKQDRYGLNGKKIKVFKFRSMTVAENGGKVTQATKGDARITKFGAFLRKTSLDELPQFLNVLAGDMSVIGPRPHAVSHNEEYRKVVDYYMLRHKVKPGITGWAQINGWRGETDTLDKMQKRVEFDLDYIRKWSLWMDIKILAITFLKGFVHKNAY